MAEENSIITIQIDLTNIVNQCYNKVEGIIRKFGSNAGDIPFPPDFDVLIKNFNEYYKYYNEYIRIGDEIVCEQMRLRLVLNSLTDFRNTKITKDLYKEYSAAQGFRNFLDYNIEKLIGYKFDLVELKRQVTDRIKLLQAVSFQN